MPHALAVESVSKCYRLHAERARTLREALTRRLSGRSAQCTELWALREVSFAVERGTTFGVIGHNGAGKSTLLRLLCGLSRPSAGRIRTAGRTSGILELGAGFDANLSGRENLLTAGILSGLPPAAVRAAEERIVAFAELERFIDQPVRTYSSGMYLRLAFASAMAFEPAVLVLDEVLAVGDERFQRKCTERIAELKRAGTTLVVTSHAPEQVVALCDEVLVLEEGRVAMQGDPATAIAAYRDLLRRRTEARAAGVTDAVDTLGEVATGSGRQGTLEAAITAVRVLDSAGRPADAIATGEALRIELDYRRAASVGDMALTLGLFNEANVKCHELTVSSMTGRFGDLPPTGSLALAIDALPVLPGRYFVNVGLFPAGWAFIYDYHWRMHALRVGGVSPAEDPPAGVLALSARWHSIPRRSAAISRTEERSC